MPSIGVPIQINHISAGGVVNVGDSVYISPKHSTKSISGSGGGNNGNFFIVKNDISITNGVDRDVNDQNQTANN
ncbi:spore germination protein [Bacillus songklensis]|uniref:Spore germination protein n=1 Tax=Bacillus songklensis TaxID=1069116 RepID=A0ABV8AZF9_9BACI